MAESIVAIDISVEFLYDLSQEVQQAAKKLVPGKKVEDLWAVVGQTQVQYSDRVLKGLEGRLKSIAKGEEPSYRDDYFRRCAAAFWANWSDPIWMRQTKSSKKVGDLLLQFLACAVKIARKSPDIDAGDITSLSNRQVETFIHLLQDEVSEQDPSDTHTRERLRSYEDLLRQQAIDTLEPKPSANIDVLKMVDIGLALLGVSGAADLSTFRNSATVQAAIIDVQTLLSTLQAEMASEDPFLDGFEDRTAWQAWAAVESKVLTERLRVFEGLRASNKTALTADHEIQPFTGTDSSSYTFIPSNPRRQYAALVRLAMSTDLAAMANLSDSEFVSVDIMSQQHLALLAECADHWRILPSTHLTAVFSAMGTLYESGDVPVECFCEALDNIKLALESRSAGEWISQDLNTAKATAKRISKVGTTEFVESIMRYDEMRQVDLDTITSLLADLAVVADVDSQETIASDLVQTADMRLSMAARHRYDDQTLRVSAATRDSAIDGRHELFRWVEKHIKGVDRRHPSVSAIGLDVTAVISKTLLETFLEDLTSDIALHEIDLVQQVTEGDLAASSCFALWHDAMKATSMLKAFTGVSFDTSRICAAFKPLVMAWLENARGTSKRWTENAVTLDKFADLNSDGCSSSLGDIFEFLQSILASLQDLAWPVSAGYADFVAHFAQLLQQALCYYSDQVEELFRIEMHSGDSQEEPSGSHSAITAIGRLPWTHRQSQDRAPAQNFTVKSCALLNNVNVAMNRLDSLYHQADIDKWAHGRVAGQSTAPASVFSIKVVQGDLDGLMTERPAVVISDEGGSCKIHTRQADDPVFPSWHESFDIRLDQRAWLMVTIISHSNGKSVNNGRAYFKLDQADFPELTVRAIWLALDQGGKVLLRITRETEKPDPQYFFGLTFKHLRRNQADMTRSFVELMRGTIRNSLSRASVARLTQGEPERVQEDLAKRLQSTYVSLMRQDRPKIGSPVKKSSPLTDIQMESAIGPLLDYFDANLQLLSATLNPVNMQNIMSALWASILLAIEDLIVPALSDRPSNMRPLRDQELDIVLKWLQFLRDYCHAGGEGQGLSLEELNNSTYQELLRIRIYYDWQTDELMEECVRDLQRSLKQSSSASGARTASNTARAQRNLGTIRQTQQQRRQIRATAAGCQMMLRVLRMRKGTESFLADQLRLLQNAASWAVVL